MKHLYVISINGKIEARFTGTAAECIKEIERAIIPTAKRYSLTDKGKSSGFVIKWRKLTIEAFPFCNA
jgi:hypothetical protein